MKIFFLHKSNKSKYSIKHELTNDQLEEFIYIHKVTIFKYRDIIKLIQYFYGLDLNPYDWRNVTYKPESNGNKACVSIRLEEEDYKKISRNYKIDRLIKA